MPRFLQRAHSLRDRVDSLGTGSTWHGGYVALEAGDTPRLPVNRDVPLAAKRRIAAKAHKMLDMPRASLGDGVCFLQNRLVARGAAGLVLIGEMPLA
jgi:hypothetical protein